MGEEGGQLLLAETKWSGDFSETVTEGSWYLSEGTQVFISASEEYVLHLTAYQRPDGQIEYTLARVGSEAKPEPTYYRAYPRECDD